MDSILSPRYLARLRALRERLGVALRRLETSRSSPTGQGRVPEFDTHRPYVPGDDPRDIDWTLFARLDRFFVKSMMREEEGVFHLLVDASASMRVPWPEKRERALEVAGALGYLALCAGQRVAAFAWADHLLGGREHRSGENGILPLLETLSSLSQGEGTDLGRSLGDFARLPSVPRSRVAVVSDLITLRPGEDALVLLASRQARTGAVQLLHPEEARLARRGHFLLTDPETGASVRRVVGYRALREMRARVDGFLAGTEGLFTRNGERFFRADTSLAFEEIVMGWFSAGRGG